MKRYFKPTDFMSASPELLVGALLALYSRHINGGKGLEKADVPVVTNFAMHWQKYKSITEMQCSFLRMKLRNYAGILSAIDVDAFVPNTVTIQNVQAASPRAVNVLKCSVEDATTLRLDFHYDESLIARIKNIPGRRWYNDSNGKYWTVPASIENIRIVMNLGFVIPKQFSTLLKSKDVELDFTGLKMNLRPYQMQGAERAAGELNLRCLIADEPGLGKTCQYLAALWSRREEAFPAAIVCPNSVKWNWAIEARMWLPDVSIRLLEGYTSRNKFTIRSKNEFIIVNYDVLADRGAKNGWAKLLRDAGLKTIGFDECHKLKNPRTQRTASVLDMCQPIPFRIGLSGTPIESRPFEFYTILSLIDPGLFPNMWEFATRYCGYTKFNRDMTGATNSKELNKILTDNVMIRRKKTDVLKELPPKITSVIPVAIDMRQYTKLENELCSFVQMSAGGGGASSAEGLARIERCKQAAALGKLPAAIEWCETYLESGRKLVVFGWHGFVLDALEKAFSGRCVRVDGSTKPRDRQMARDKFQTDDSIMLFIGNLQAAGEGITLTAASDTLTLELAWTPSKHDQASDRVHRIGQTADSVTAYYMIAKDTIEEDIMQLLDEKRKVVTQVLDGKDAEHTSLLTDLMNRLKQKEKENKDAK